MSKSFPTLYATASTGKEKVWRIRVKTLDTGEAEIISSHGYADGKMTETPRTISAGKNIGKKNATTPFQQAVAEAEAGWNKKRDAGYKTRDEQEIEEENVLNPDVNVVVTVPLPMLAHDYNKRGKDIKFPCFTQRKLDGVRCVAIPQRGLFSRNAKLFPGLANIKAEIDTLPPTLVLDGELYSDTLDFQEVVGLVKKANLSKADTAKQQQIYLCVYDLVDETNTYSQRKTDLEQLFATHKFNSIRLLTTEECANKECIESMHNKYVEEGYEGLMLRNKAGNYSVGHRSKELQKYKHFQDEDYEIVGFLSGEGMEKGCVIWRCVTPEGVEFTCRPRGTHEERRELFLRAKPIVGKRLTVRFQELSNDGVPRFPVGIAIRDYE